MRKILYKFLFLVAAFGIMANLSAQEKIYLEQDGLLTIEAEELDLPSEWAIVTSKPGFSGNGHITYTGESQFRRPGRALITVKFRITKTGTYRFLWRNAVGDGTVTSEYNDSWLRFPDADDFFGRRNSDGGLVFPIGSGRTPEPEGAGANNWFKVYTGGNTNWRWRAETSDNDPHQIFVTFNNPGVYTMEISGRSQKHLIDRISLDNGATNPLAINTPSSPVEGSTGTGCNNLTLGAVADFQNINVNGFRPAVVDRTRDVLSIDASQFKDEFAAANTTFNGASGTYNLTLNTLLEFDGESTYRIRVGGNLVGEFQNRPTNDDSEDFAPFRETFNNITVNNGDLIQVEFNSHSNGLIEEGDGFAFARGRWSSLDFICTDGNTNGNDSTFISGSLNKWEKIVLTHTISETLRETDPSTFLNNRMDVIFTHESGASIRVPGYFAGDGNAANTSATSGNQYKAILRPNRTGLWTYRILLYSSNNVTLLANDDLPNPDREITGTVGVVGELNATAPDLRVQGKLNHISNGTDQERRYLRWAETGEYFLKIGPDSPENLLNYDDFDDETTGNIDSDFTPEHSYAPHAADFENGNPTWGNGRGRNVMGAINFLRDQRMNSYSLSLFGGDDLNIQPWRTRDTKFQYDLSKLDQWGIVFDHAERQGLMIHFKLAENENWDALTRNEIRVYYREMVARYGHLLGLEWNIAEEYRGTPESSVDRINHLADIDGYNSHRVIHTHGGEHDLYFGWLALDVPLTGASIQSGADDNFRDAYNGNTGILTWINNSRNVGKPWVVSSDEQNPARTGMFSSVEIGNSNARTEARTRIIWPTFLAGGSGVMWYGGRNGDFKTEDFGRFNTLFRWSRYAALDFFKKYNVEFWRMENRDDLASGNALCLADPGRSYVIYLEQGGSTNLNLSGQTGSYEVRWFDPRNGGDLQNGSILTIAGGGNVSIGNPPSSANRDWAILITNEELVEDPNLSPTVSFIGLSNGTILFEGADLGVTVDADDRDGSVSNVRLFINNQLVRQENQAPYDWGTANEDSDDPLLLNLAVGEYVLRAEATDNLGATSVATVTITVNPEGLVELSPINDAYLQGQAETNFDNEDLRVENGNRVSYIMFDLSTLPEGVITSATLELSVGNDAGEGTIRIFQVGDNWQEETINGSNKPTLGSEVGTFTGQYNLGVRYDADLTGVDYGGNTVSFALIADAGGNDVSFASKENNIDPIPSLVLIVDDNITGIFGREDTNGINIFPNPTSNSLTITGTNENWTIITTTGVNILSGNSRDINVSFLEAGMYIVEFEDGEREVFIKE